MVRYVYRRPPDFGERRRLSVLLKLAVSTSLTVTEDTFQNVEPFDNDESIDTVLATGGTPPYTWEIISQDLL